MAVSWRITFFQKKIGWNPYFYSVFGCAFSGPRCQNKAIFGHPVKKKENFDWELRSSFFGIFVFFTFSFLIFLFFCFFCCFFVLFCFCLFFGEALMVRWGGRAKPSLFLYCLVLFLFFFPFLSLLLIDRNPVSPLEKGIFCLFSMFLFLSPLTFFGLPLFLFLFLCLSLSLVFLSSFLSFFLLSFCFLFLSLFHFSFFFAFVSWKEQHENFQLQFIFSWNIFSFFWFPVLVFLSNPFFLSLLFPDFTLCFCSTSMFLVSK